MSGISRSTNLGSSIEPTTSRSAEDIELACRLAAAYRILIQAARRARGTGSEQLLTPEPDAPEAGGSQNQGESTSGPVEAQADEIDGSVDQGDQPPSTAANDVSGGVQR